MLNAIVFDFDGIIVDSEPLHYRAFVRVARQLHVSITWDQYLDQFVGYDDRDAFRVMLGGQAGVTDNAKIEAQLAQLGADKAAAFEAEVQAGITPMPGIDNLIHEACEQKFPIAIASGATRWDIDLILNQLGWRNLFDPIITADQVQYSKPHPQSYAMAVRKLAQQHPTRHLTPENCLAIEDTSAGLRSARDAGLATLAITNTETPEQLSHAHRVIDSLEAVTLDQLQQWFG